MARLIDSYWYITILTLPKKCFMVLIAYPLVFQGPPLLKNVYPTNTKRSWTDSKDKAWENNMTNTQIIIMLQILVWFIFSCNFLKFAYPISKASCTVKIHRTVKYRVKFLEVATLRRKQYQLFPNDFLLLILLENTLVQQSNNGKMSLSGVGLIQQNTSIQT